jgi:hypothetical protein
MARIGTENWVMKSINTFVSNDVGAAAKEPTELFIKNTGLC